MKLFVKTPTNGDYYVREDWVKIKTYLFSQCNAYESVILLGDTNESTMIKDVLKEAEFKGDIEDELDSRYHILELNGELRKSWED